MKVLVTGGASGLGLEITRSLLENNIEVFFTYKSSQQAADELVKYSKQRCNSIFCDFESMDSVGNLKAHIEKLDIDAIVNNALPRFEMKRTRELTPEYLKNSFEVNVLPIITITQACLDLFKKKRSGRVINILTSYLINKPPTGLAEYTANKAYVLSMAKSWAQEYSKFDIAINNILPSIMRTNLTSTIDERMMETMEESNPFNKLVTPQAIAEVVCFLIRAPIQLNSVTLPINGGENVL